MFPLTDLLFFAATFLTLLSILSNILRRRKKSIQNEPPSIPAIPVLGSLPFIAWNAAGHMPRYFLKKSKELGPIFTFKNGSREYFVLNSFESIEEAFVRKSSIFAGRQGFLTDILCGNKERKGVVASYSNANWKYHHRLSLSILREYGFGNNNVMEKRISQEVMELVQCIKSMNGRSFNPKDLALKTSANIIHQLLFADRFSYSQEIHDLYKLGSAYIDSFLPIIDVAPWLRFLPYFRQKIQQTSKIHCKLFQSIKELVDAVKSGVQDEGFVSRYLEKETLDCDMEQLFLIIRDLALAGMDTTGTTVLWSLLYLANNQTIQSKLRKSIDEGVPRSRLPSYADKKNLPYMEAFILEVQRIRTLLPVAIPHETLTDTQVSGFFVPAGTAILTNLYAAHMDPKFWKDPEDFRPERFLDENGEIVNRDRCIPFSLGRRSCLGQALARQELFLIVSGLVQNFVVLPPENQEVIVVEEVVRALSKPTDFQVRFVFRDV